MATSKMKSNDRILVLEKIDDGKGVGLVDPKVFTGNNKLHAVMDEGTLLWSFRYDHGIVPGPLKDRFSSFKVLKQHAEDYFRNRNIKIKEVIE